MKISLNPKFIVRWLLAANVWFWPSLALALGIGFWRSRQDVSLLYMALDVGLFVIGFILAHLAFYSEATFRQLSDIIFSRLESTAQQSRLTNDFVVPTRATDAVSFESILHHSLMLLVMPVAGITIIFVTRNLTGLGFLWGLSLLYAIDIFPLLQRASPAVRQQYFSGWPSQSDVPMVISLAYYLYVGLFTILLCLI